MRYFLGVWLNAAPRKSRIEARRVRGRTAEGFVGVKDCESRKSLYVPGQITEWWACIASRHLES